MIVVDLILNTLSQGLCYALVAMGVYISYKLLDFPDLSVDGSFPLGAVLSVVLIKADVPAIPAVLIAMIGGGIAGFITGFLHVKFKISALLSGIITMTALLSITLNLTRLVPNPSTGQTGNISTLISYFKNADATLFNGFLRDWFAFKPIAGDILLLLIIVAVVKILMDMFFRTKTGFMIKATGNNEQFVVSMAKAPGFYKIIGLCIANAAVALGGAVYSQQLSYFDNSAGVGMVVIALASVIIGTSIFARVKKVKGTTASVIGAVIYSFFLSLAVFVGIDSTYLKLLMAALFAAVLIINYYSGKKRKRVNGGRIGSDIRRR